MSYVVQVYNRTSALWTTLHTFEGREAALACFDRLVERETDYEVSYRVLSTEVVNLILRQS